MSHSDTSWRVGAIYRCCVRYNKDMLWAQQKLEELCKRSEEDKIIAGHSYPQLAQIWFRRATPSSINHIEIQRREYRSQKDAA